MAHLEVLEDPAEAGEGGGDSEDQQETGGDQDQGLGPGTDIHLVRDQIENRSLFCCFYYCSIVSGYYDDNLPSLHVPDLLCRLMTERELHSISDNVSPPLMIPA